MTKFFTLAQTMRQTKGLHGHDYWAIAILEAAHSVMLGQGVPVHHEWVDQKSVTEFLKWATTTVDPDWRTICGGDDEDYVSTCIEMTVCCHFGSDEGEIYSEALQLLCHQIQSMVR